MRVIIDGDACPVIKQTCEICEQFEVEVLIVCDDTHEIADDYATVIYVEKGSDSADYKILSLIDCDDIVVTNDYGLSALVIAKNCLIINFDGLEVTSFMIDSMLEQRAFSSKLRKSKIHIKGPKKRTIIQDQSFEKKLSEILRVGVKSFRNNF